VVTYDRWGSGIRFKHGSVYTPEYQPDLDFEDHAWEESRGMGFSYGYNREEDSWDYNSTQSLVLQLIDKVSRGGNFLLDIGPDEHGKIPPIMQERLLQIGDWLKINGEAIYNTVRWKTPAQWSDGRRDYTSKSGDMLLKITIDPDPGYAVKEVFYTYNASNNDLYALLPKFPDNRNIVLKDMQLPVGTSISFLSTKEQLKWKQAGKDIEIELPEYNPNKIKAPYAYAIKISGFGKFASKPQIKTEYINGSLQPTISIQAAANEAIYYTTDGTEPTTASLVYNKPFALVKSATIKARTFGNGVLPGSIAEEAVTRHEWQKAVTVSNASVGISYKYFEPTGKIDLNVINTGTATKSGVATIINESVKQRKEKYVLSFEGYVKVNKDGVVHFSTLSDDGSKLFINDIEVVNNDGEHGSVEKSGKAALKKGYHKIRVVYFDSGGGNELKVYWQPEGGKKGLIPAGVLFH
jgi:Alpha-L-fucosidase/PA14 domain/Fn3 associated/Alpha-L-fucosidase C-terminal domain